MSVQDLQPDPPLTAEQARAAAALLPEQLLAIDHALLTHASVRWRKVAFIVASAMNEPGCRPIALPDIFFSSRVRALVVAGLLESCGDLGLMRYSEVRLPVSRPEGRT